MILYQHQPPPNLTDNVEVYNSELIENSLVLAVENGGTSSSLVNKEGHKVKEWTFECQSWKRP